MWEKSKVGQSLVAHYAEERSDEQHLYDEDVDDGVDYGDDIDDVKMMMLIKVSSLMIQKTVRVNIRDEYEGDNDDDGGGDDGLQT